MKDFRELQHVRIITREGTIAKGDICEDDVIIRCDDHGFLHDSIDEDGDRLPAIETRDGSHREYWTHGVLNCPVDNEGHFKPAVVDNIDKYELWFVNGKEYPPMK
ncbi:hypothetical protein [Treponema sp. Marseille-Q3903]|uniref:hypothetical protein n=1 Tax=Treponema sp. Marseille-Q3903 TaxID=2766703 RepID=UPI001651CFE7|nr:hypothetical protein [Treponema sp. Marseille-Q3903]MBC6713579.1 hypothetical protein [Treponema sp. Marseille-Q3903]